MFSVCLPKFRSKIQRSDLVYTSNHRLSAILCCLSLALLSAGASLYGQYTDIINSNRPGNSMGAYSVGKGVLQWELGGVFDQQDHQLLRYKSMIYQQELSMRYGLIGERLEISAQWGYQWESTLGSTFKDIHQSDIALKLLLFDPYKNPQFEAVNLYSWKDQHRFKLKRLIPALSAGIGYHFFSPTNLFNSWYPTNSPKFMLFTQNSLTNRLVLVTNHVWDHVQTDWPEYRFLASLTHTLGRDWSVFYESEFIKNDLYADHLLRIGGAFLQTKNLQWDTHFALNFKETPRRKTFGIGISYRIDPHN